MADISFWRVTITAYDIKLSGDHGASLAPDGILDVIHGGDQNLSCWEPSPDKQWLPRSLGSMVPSSN